MPMLRALLLTVLAVTTLVTAWTLRVAALESVLALVLPASTGWLAARTGSALGLGVLLFAAISAARVGSGDRRALAMAAVSVTLACGVGGSDWFVGAWSGVVVAVELDGGEPVGQATDLPPLEMFLSPDEFVLLGEDGEEAVLDLGALPGLVRLAAWFQVFAAGILPAIFAAFCIARAREWWQFR